LLVSPDSFSLDLRGLVVNLLDFHEKSSFVFCVLFISPDSFSLDLRMVFSAGPNGLAAASISVGD
jgi:hypothetical protein